MEAWSLSLDQVIGGIVGIGLVAKGILDRIVRQKEATARTTEAAAQRGCLYGDTAHEELKGIMTNVLSLTREIRDNVNIIKARGAGNG